jgi:hypothetical protein
MKNQTAISGAYEMMVKTEIEIVKNGFCEK